MQYSTSEENALCHWFFIHLPMKSESFGMWCHIRRGASIFRVTSWTLKMVAYLSTLLHAVTSQRTIILTLTAIGNPYLIQNPWDSAIIVQWYLIQNHWHSNVDIIELLLSSCSVSKAEYPTVLDVDQWTRVLFEKLNYSDTSAQTQNTLTVWYNATVTTVSASYLQNRYHFPLQALVATRDTSSRIWK